MLDPRRWPRILSILGGIGVLVGALDPLEGSALILPASGLLALGSYVGHENRRTTLFRLWGFILIAIGVGAMFVMSAAGGIGGSSGHSAWWAVLLLPFLIGWSIDVWGPGSPRWVLGAGIAIGAWYLFIAVMPMVRRATAAPRPLSIAPNIVLACVGLLTVLACVVRLRKPTIG